MGGMRSAGGSAQRTVIFEKTAGIYRNSESCFFQTDLPDERRRNRKITVRQKIALAESFLEQYSLSAESSWSPEQTRKRHAEQRKAKRRHRIILQKCRLCCRNKNKDCQKYLNTPNWPQCPYYFLEFHYQNHVCPNVIRRKFSWCGPPILGS